MNAYPPPRTREHTRTPCAEQGPTPPPQPYRGLTARKRSSSFLKCVRSGPGWRVQLSRSREPPEAPSAAFSRAASGLCRPPSPARCRHGLLTTVCSKTLLLLQTPSGWRSSPRPRAVRPLFSVPAAPRVLPAGLPGRGLSGLATGLPEMKSLTQ